MSLENDLTTLLKMKSGYACLSYNQFLHGSCILFADPVVSSINDLDVKDRETFLSDMSFLGDAIIEVCGAARINYGILGNSHPELHTHLFPRYKDEPSDKINKNVWQYPEEYWTDEKYLFNLEKHADLKRQLIESLKNIIKDVY